MRLRLLTRSAFVLLPLLVFAGRFHAQRVPPGGMTQEVNRCLTIVRVAASRRKSSQEREERQALESALSGRERALDPGAAALVDAQPLARTA